MVNSHCCKNKIELEWLEVIDPTPTELEYLAAQYGLPANSLKDCLEPNHLPKFEEIEGFNFIIFRVYDVYASKNATTVQQLTRKIALFHSPDQIVTVQRAEMPLTQALKEGFAGREKHLFAEEILIKYIEYSLQSYETPANLLIEELNQIEGKIFFEKKIPRILGDLYFIKKKADVMSRLLILYKDILTSSGRHLPKHTYLRDVIDLHIRLENIYKTIQENASHLINVYFSLASQRTNEIMQVLTLFSAFFLPLTFIAGVYGMNFEIMPELKWKAGYFYTWSLMLIVALGIYAWFKRKGWI
ncbi:MAG: magnesium transporter CorA [Microscillaceae bacterium]|nr:magnesium transporter CorA [Microscillaceae bacterium]